ncbi:MAG: MATE family efflux transporter [Cyclobacteriaceae bacterium]|nr:MATE family efflux transporter [Cyclobacteriaceae bacterium]
MISMLGQVMTGVADSIMIGWTGAVPLAASSLANSFFTVLLFFGVGVSYAITPLVAEASGSGDERRIIDALRHGMIINLVTGVVLVAIVISGQQVLVHIGQPADVVDLAIPYLLIITYSIIPTMIFQTFRQFAEGLHRTRMAMVIMIVSNLLNVVLNYVLIYGIWIFPEMGLNGAGWATFIARVVMAVWMGAYVFYGHRFTAYRAGFRFGDYSRSLINRMLHIGIPAGAQFIFEAAAFGFSAIMMGWLGANTLAAHQIAINLATVSYMTTSGLGAAATIRVGTFLGQRDGVAVRRSGFTLIGLGIGIMLLWAIAFIAGKHLLPGFYIDNASVLEIAAPLMVIAGFFQMSDGVQVVCAGALRGLQDVKIPSLLIFVAYWVLALPIGYVLAFVLGYGALGIWMGLLLGLTLTAGAMVWRFNQLSRRPL